MFDTHAHLNFEAFKENYGQVIKESLDSGVECIVIPSSSVENSKIAVEIAQQYDNVYAAVGIHPFHLFGHIKFNTDMDDDYLELEELLKQDKIVAIGEVGLDRHNYKSKKYPDYVFGEELFDLQKKVFIEQIKLAKKYQKTLIIHNRGAVPELLEILESHWDKWFEGKTVFHFCEADERMIEFAKKHHVYIGVDGDVTFDEAKQEFVKKIPLDLLVLETDSPYIIPEPLKSRGETINYPKNLRYILETIGKLTAQNVKELEEIIDENSKLLFKELLS